MKTFVYACLCLSIFVSCKKETVEGPAGPQGPAGASGSASSGSLSGKVRQYDEFGIEYSSNLNTTTISVEGTTLFTITNANGNYTISNVPSGIYDLTFTKINAGLMKQKQITFPGNGTLYNSTKVGDKPSFAITSAMLKDSTLGVNPIVYMNFKMVASSQQRTIGVVLSNAANLDLASPSSYQAVHLVDIPSNTSNLNSQFLLQSSLFSMFPMGSIVYAKAYPINATPYGYYDPAADQDIYTNYGAAFPITFTLTRKQ
ncbi:MAG: hypothetical protein PSX36_11750 [bacterium]|nr:hypothetical protein [bacterium]